MSEKSIEFCRVVDYGQRDAGQSSVCELPESINNWRDDMDSLSSYFEGSTLSNDYVTDSTHLVMASTSGDIEDVHKYLRKGAKVSTGDFRPVLGAAMNGHIEVLKVLFAAEKVPLQAIEGARRLAKDYGEAKTVDFLRSILESPQGRGRTSEKRPSLE